MLLFIAVFLKVRVVYDSAVINHLPSQAIASLCRTHYSLFDTILISFQTLSLMVKAV